MNPTLLVGTDNGLHLIGSDHAVTLIGHRITALASDGEYWWTILDRRVIQRSANLEEWEEVARSQEFEISCLAATASGIWAGSYAAHLFRLNGELERIASFDEAEGRDSWFTPWGGPPETRSLAASTDGTLYANIHVGGILRSRDNGRGWQPTIQVRSDVHEVLAHPDDPRLVLAPSGWGLGLSRDGGDSWEFMTEGLHGRYCRAVAVSGDLAFISASTGSSSRQGAIYRVDLNHPDSFERCRNGLPEWTPSNIDTFCLAASGSRVAFGAEAGTVYLSENGGETWETVASGLPPVRCVEFG